MTSDNTRTRAERHNATISYPSDTELVITRTFSAPRDLVWRAMTTPEHIRRWYGCEMGEMTICDVDLRVGGSWRYGVTVDGRRFVFSGEYEVLEPPTRLVSTERFENMPGAEYHATLTLDEVDGITHYRNHLRYPNREMRDGHVNSGMEYGMNKGLDAMEKIAVDLAG